MMKPLKKKHQKRRLLSRLPIRKNLQRKRLPRRNPIRRRLQRKSTRRRKLQKRLQRKTRSLSPSKSQRPSTRAPPRSNGMSKRKMETKLRQRSLPRSK